MLLEIQGIDIAMKSGRAEQVDGKLWDIVSEIFCIFYAFIYGAAGVPPSRSNSGIMMPCLFPPAALPMAVYQMLIVNRCYCWRDLKSSYHYNE